MTIPKTTPMRGPDLHITACIQFFREGAPIIGELPYSGNGTRLLVTQEADVEGLLDKAPIGNLRVLERLREDPHARKLHEAC